jgi:peptidoglycan pentaglycine glycine transferase (the first glycine)
MAHYQDRLLAVRTAYCFGQHAAEFHAGSMDHPLNLAPNYLLVWEAIKWAKAQGCSTYDLWGIPDEIGWVISEGDDMPEPVRADGMWGVYQFKRGFGKNIVSYIGAYDYVYGNSLYALASNRVITAYLDWVTAWMDWLRPT